MFIAEKAKGVNWVKAAPKVQTQVNARISGPRKNSSFFSLYGFQLKLAASPLLHTIPIYSNPTQIHYQLGQNLTEPKLQQITSANKSKRLTTPYEKGDQVIISKKKSALRTTPSSHTFVAFLPLTKTKSASWCAHF